MPLKWGIEVGDEVIATTGCGRACGEGVEEDVVSVGISRWYGNLTAGKHDGVDCCALQRGFHKRKNRASRYLPVRYYGADQNANIYLLRFATDLGDEEEPLTMNLYQIYN